MIIPANRLACSIRRGLIILTLCFPLDLRLRAPVYVMIEMTSSTAREASLALPVAGRFAILCQFANWTFRTFGCFDTRTFRYLPGVVSPPVLKLVICNTVTISSNLFLYLIKGVY